uniref:Ig-like domain-containing protein n=1 Tax=Eptatretus burgeri TaxID=7764 RepID=A0A8C4QK57_EPTBU
MYPTVRPQILRIGRRFVNSRTSWRLLCEAEAKPGPNITWWNPQGLILNESHVLLDQDDPNKVQIIMSTLNITKKELEGRYWCLAQNKHGTAEVHIDFCETPVQEVSWMVVIWSTSLWVVVLLFGVGLFFCTKSWKHQGVKQGHRRTSNFQEPDQRDENTYMAVSKEDHSDDNTYTAVPNTFSISEDQLYENI